MRPASYFDQAFPFNSKIGWCLESTNYKFFRLKKISLWYSIPTNMIFSRRYTQTSFFVLAVGPSIYSIILIMAFLAPAGASPVLPEKGKSPPIYNLNDCLTLALERNASILHAELDIKRTQGVIISAKSVLYPHATMSGRMEERNDDTFDQGTDPTQQGFRDYWVVQVSATQSIYSAGVNQQQIAIAQLQNQTSLVQLQAVTDQVLRSVHDAVYEIIFDQAQIDAWKKSCQLLSEELTRQQQYFDAGKTTRFSILRTQVNLGNQQAELYQAQGRLVSSQVALAQLLNIEWPVEDRKNPPFYVQDELSCPPVRSDLQTLTTQALSHRPELEVIQHQIEIAQRQIEIDKATNVPRLDAFAAIQQYRDQTQADFNRSINNYSIGVLGSWDIFDGFNGRGKVMSDTASLDSSKISLNTTRLQIQNEVRDAYERLKTAEVLVQDQTANIKTAEDSVRLSQNSADAGYATPLDILQATLDLTTARLEAIRARFNYMQALADLQYAISLKFQDMTESSGKALPVPPGSPSKAL